MAHKKQQEKLIFDTLSEEQKDFFIQSLEKKVRNLNKKLKEIQQLEKDRKEGKELKDTQLNKIATKDEHNSKKKELDNIARLYIEARAEAVAEKKDTVATDATATVSTVPANEVVSQLAQLFFAAQYAYQTNSNTDLALYFTNVFNNVSSARVSHAVAELTTYVAGENPTLQAQVVQVTASEGFNAQSAFYVKTEPTTAHVEEQQVVEEPQQVEEVAQTHDVEHVHHHHHHEEADQHHDHHHGHHHEEKPVAEHTEEKHTTEQAATEHVEGEVPAVEGEPTKEASGEKKFHKKPYQKRTNSGGQRKPREPRGEGENNQHHGGEGEHKRGQRPHHNGPRHGGNRSNKRNQDGEHANENENTGNRQDDGWNVVTKGPQKNEGGYKPRTREGGNHHHNNNNTNGTNQKRGDGQKRPNHSGNKRPYNKDRPQQGEQGQNQQQYVRKDKPATETPEQPAQN